MRTCLLVSLSQVDYRCCLELQRRLWDLRVKDEIVDTLVLVEHPPVITLGKSARPENVLASAGELVRLGVEVHRVERGGDVTFHGPGQLVGYPVFRLGQGLVGVRPFVDGLERALVVALSSLGVRAQTRPGTTGVWVEDRKVASIGIAVRRWVSLHGFALNVTTDLSFFGLVNPCGMAQVRMTSVECEGGRTDDAVVRQAVIQGCAEVLGLDVQTNLPRRVTLLTNGLRHSAIA
jgi:lipoate-protein ligase B